MITIDNVDYDYALVLPISEHYALDESLDNAVIRIDGIERATRFEPYTVARVTKGTDTNSYYIAKDTVKKIVGTNLYNHTIALIELTKLTEKFVIDTNTVTQPQLVGILNDVPVYVTETDLMNNFKYGNNSQYKCVYLTGESLNVIPADNFNFLSQIGYAEGIQIYHNDTVTTLHGGTATTTLTLETGNYEFWYVAASSNGTIIDKFTITVMPSIVQKDKKTITDVVNKLCRFTKESRFNSSINSEFVFNSTQATEYSQIIAPEFSFTKCTLWEALSQVGGYIHAIPRVEFVDNKKTIFFDKLGQNEVAEINGDLIGESEEQDIEQYCTEIDTNIDNIVNLDSAEQGTIIEPYANGYETVRVEEGTIQIKDDNAIIETEYPIMSVAKVEVGYIDNRTATGLEVGDITPYVYEQSEYLALSSVSGGYPNSKAFAIYYTQGQKGIKGLSFTLPNAISSLFSHKAIINIISQKVGYDVENLFTTYGITKLNFRVTYFPIVSARVKQTKTNMLEFKTNTTSIYNQGANVVDSNAYGENLKGAVARLGNIEKSKTYIIPNIEDLNNIKVGQKHEDYYISAITQEIYKDYAKATIYLSKDFNRLNQYIGIKQNLRMYEVSEKQSVDRYKMWNDYCIISTSRLAIQQNEESIFNTYFFLVYFLDDFIKDEIDGKLSCVRFRGYNVINGTLQPVQNYYVDLPIVSLGIGNSIYLGFKMHDNYSAGNKSEESTNSTGSDYYRVQQYVPYGDYWGEIDYAKIEVCQFGQTITNVTDAINIGNALPEEKSTIGPALITTDNNPIEIYKDSREILNFAIMLHFISNKNENIVIGSAIANKNGMVNDKTENEGVSIYSSTTYTDKFAKVIDTSNMQLIENIETNDNITMLENNQASITVDNVPNTTKSLVFVRADTKELVFAINKEQFDSTTTVYLTITHDLSYYK